MERTTLLQSRSRWRAHSVNLSDPTQPIPKTVRVHFVGIGGIGMSALAKILLEEGYTVSGSDWKLTPLTASLETMGARVFEGHKPEHVNRADLIVTTSAARGDNPEIVAGRTRGIPVIKGSQMLGRMMAGKLGVCVAGTHGKTTTTAMISEILMDANLDPTFVVGGEIRDLGTNGHLGTGTCFVAEADEFDRRFLDLNPSIAVVTNIEPDHLDYYGSFENVLDAFLKFLQRVPADGTIVACWDDPGVRRVVEALRGRGDGRAGEQGSRGTGAREKGVVTQFGPRVVTYGVNRPGKWWASSLRVNAHGGFDFTAWHVGRNMGEFSLRVPGQHNVSNALAALATANLLGVNLDQVRATLARFSGAARRFEIKGMAQDITVVDDYAHHPTEIRATLAAARVRYPGRLLWVCFQPHTYSRTKLLLAEFARAFDQADHVIITDIYAAREFDTLGVHASDMVALMNHPDARYIGRTEEAAAYLAQHLRPGDVLLTLGAGDVWQVGEWVLARL